jgi:hypothetical protein
MDTGVSSYMSILLKDWERLKELRLIDRSSVIMRACPSLVIERQPVTQYTTENELMLRNTADDLLRMNNAAGTKPSAFYALLNPLTFSRPGDAMGNIIDAVKKGEHYDIKDGALVIPPGYTASMQPKIDPFDITVYEQQFEANVLAILNVPPSFYNSARTGSGGLNDGKKTEQSENERWQFMSGVNLSVRDIVHFFRCVYTIIAEADVTVLLPTATFSTLEEFEKLYALNIIGAQTTREHVARRQGIHPDHVIQGKGGDLQIKQTEWQPPQKKTK